MFVRFQLSEVVYYGVFLTAVAQLVHDQLQLT